MWRSILLTVDGAIQITLHGCYHMLYFFILQAVFLLKDISTRDSEQRQALKSHSQALQSKKAFKFKIMITSFTN